MHAITRSGWIEVITGSMFSGKTEELLRRLRRADIAGQEIVAFKPAIDNRYGEATIGSHNGRQWDARIVPNEGDAVWELYDRYDGEEVVAIDEANFFSSELVEVSQTLASDGARVIVSGIDQTFRGEPFDPVPRLMAVAEYVDKLQAICSVCGEPATRNQRLIDGEPAHRDDPTILVGAEESYEARCRNCHTLRTGPREDPVDRSAPEADE
ncbi:Thymidine kinase [Halalkaliarchaeum sp. AArc-CO]|uniref:thymidine kinase n=1 Tax=unclassified Halalkaliarchaeum TaxID=2678344 RepID=UPI00217D17BB|nr:MULTISPECIES: thymidine kinase [unclassified Halalkaliarchaeum]MDR5671940.1 thymidine kinase [Halalkaliarchaeum sp. AArc-GB]UWG51445.1 Thymidine kinase [Halalkaliarchaeum sp. AArc-CO]